MVDVEIVKQILASDIIGWILAFLGGVLVFQVIDNMQTNIERHAVIKDVENTINQLFSSKLAKSNQVVEEGEESNKQLSVMVRTVLHDNTPWKEYDKDKDVLIVEGQRYIRIRDDEKYKEYLSTQAIHELLITFRRIEKLYKDGILKPIDLADMWREILPFAASGRVEFYHKYLGDSDVKSIIFVLFNTLLACKKHEVDNAVNYFCLNYNRDSLVSTYYIINTRYSWKEKFQVYKFKRIVSDV